MPAANNAKASLAVLFSVIVVDLIGFGVAIPILPFYADAYGADGLELGALLSSYAAMQFVFSPLWGRLSDRIGRRPVMLLTIAGTAASLIAAGLATSFEALFVARILAGVFGANITVATAYLTDITEPEERTKWMGRVGASFGIGFTLGPAIGGPLALYGYHVPMLFAGGLALANLGFALISLREPVVHHARDGTSLGRLAALRQPLIGRLSLLFFLFSLAVTQLEAMFAFFMKDRFGYDALEVAFILVAIAVVMGGVQGGAMGRLASRFGERRLLVFGCSAMALCFAIIPQIHRVAVLLPVLLCLGIGRALSHPPMLSLVSIAASAATRGVVMGAFQSGGHLARIIGPLIAGALYDLDVSYPFAVASATVALVALLSLRLPATAAEVSPA